MYSAPPMQASAEPDLCAREPIHLPGSIQPHGALLVLDPTAFTLLQASSNASEVLGAELRPGGPWPRGVPLLDAVLRAVRSARAEGVASATLSAEGHRLSLQLHAGPQGLLVELEASSSSEADTFDALYPRIRSFVDRIEQAADVRGLCDIAAGEVRRLTGFHRVMVYRFNAEWHGTVIAEDGDGTLPSYLDLRFPASDIPAQARELYRRTRLRLIPDAHYTPVPVLPAASPRDGAPLDLSAAALRGVSPVHLTYMRNMGTAASMSISILFDGALWGLISCHHAEPRVLGPQLRSSCDFIGQLLAMQIGSRERGAHADARLALKDVESELLARVSRAPTVSSGLAESPEPWLRLAGASGAAVVKDGSVLTAGRTPSNEQLGALAAWLHQRRMASAPAAAEVAQASPPGTAPRIEGQIDTVFQTHELPRHHPAAAAYTDTGCGLLAVPISALHAHYIFWFRPELVHTVRWGGEPVKATDAEGRLHPRLSFSQWAEEVRGKAERWGSAEVEAVASFRNSVVSFVLKRAEERALLTEKLETTNRELEAFSYSVSHDLRAPFRHVVGYAQLLREREEQLDERARHYLDAIIASALSAGQLVDDLLSFSQLGRATLDITRVDMDKMVTELRRSMEIDEGERRIEWRVAPLPPAFADAGLLRQAMANLLDNAVKYTGGRALAIIEVSGDDRSHETVYTIRDNGVGFDMTYVGKLFGVFQRLHRAEEFEGTGIGLALVRRIVDRHGGWIAAEGRIGEGAVFRIGVPKPAKEHAR